jgi:hypothetical protein
LKEKSQRIPNPPIMSSYSLSLLEKVKPVLVEKPHKLDIVRDCFVCWKRIGQNGRLDQKQSTVNLLDKYRQTFALLFNIYIAKSTKYCSHCAKIVNKALTEQPEDELRLKLHQTIFPVEKIDNLVNSPPANEKETNHNSPMFNESIQSESKDLGTPLKKRDLEANLSPLNPNSKKVKREVFIVEGSPSTEDVSVRKMPQMFAKLEAGPGRPSTTPELVDYLADSQTVAKTSSAAAGKCMEIFSQSFMGITQDPPSTCTALRALCIKAVAADYKIAKWISEQSEIYLELDGGSESDRKFLEVSLQAIDTKGKISKQFLNLLENYGPSHAQKAATFIYNSILGIARMQITMKMTKIVSLCDITGVVFDTTSENTGKLQGIYQQLEALRKEEWKKLRPNEPYVPMSCEKCCDHVSQLFGVWFIKSCNEEFKKIGAPYDKLVVNNVSYIINLAQIYANLLTDDTGNSIKTKIDQAVKTGKFKTKCTGSFEKCQTIRFVAVPNLFEKMIEFEEFIIPEFDDLQEAKRMTDPQDNAWTLWKTNPGVRMMAFLLVKLSNEFMKPMMEVGNKEHSFVKWREYLQKLLDSATKLKHSRCGDLSIFMKKRFENFGITTGKRFYVLMSESITGVLRKWCLDIIESDGGDRFIVCTNRESERYISIIKWALHKHPHIRHILILAYLKLQYCRFSFKWGIPSEFQIAFMQSGRNLYNNAKTHKEINTLKAEVYDQYLKIDLYKARAENIVGTIKTFILACGTVPSTEVKTFSLTNKTMKDFLCKLKRHEIYSGKTNLTKVEYHNVIVSEIMPKTAQGIRDALVEE